MKGEYMNAFLHLILVEMNTLNDQMIFYYTTNSGETSSSKSQILKIYNFCLLLTIIYLLTIYFIALDKAGLQLGIKRHVSNVFSYLDEIEKITIPILHPLCDINKRDPTKQLAELIYLVYQDNLASFMA